MSITDADRKMLALSDSIDAERPGRHRTGPRQGRRGMLGTMTELAVLEMHCAGRSAIDIAKAAGVTTSAVTTWRRRRGITRKWTRRSDDGTNHQQGGPERAR